MPDVKYVVTVDSTGAQKSIETLDQAFAKLKGETKDTGTAVEGTGSKFGGLWKQFAIGQLAVQALHKVYAAFKGFVVDAVKGAMDEEASQTALATALELTGKAASISQASLMAFAKAQMMGTIYTDEQVQGVETLLIQLTKLDEAGIKRATRGVIGLAAVMGTDLDSAARTVQKAMEGNYTALQRIGIKVDENLVGAEKQNALLDKLEGLYGRATAQAGTFSGMLTQLKNMWKEAGDELGKAIVGNEKVRDLVESVKTKIIDLIESGKLAEWAERAAKGIGLIVDAFDVFMGTVDRLSKGGQVTEWLAGFISGATKAEAEYIVASKKLILDLQSSLQIVKLNQAETALALEKGAEGWAAYATRMREIDAQLSKERAMPRFIPPGSIQEIYDLAAALKELALKDTATLTKELDRAGKALKAAIAAGEAPGVIEALKKKIVELTEALYPGAKAWRDYQMASAFAREQATLTYKAFRDIDVAPIEGSLLTIQERLYGVGLAAIIASRGVDQDLINSFNEIRQKAGDAANGIGLILRVNLVNDLRKKRDELREFGKAMPYEEVKKLKEEIAELERKLAAGTQWDRFTDKAVKAMAKIKAVTDAAFAGMDAASAQSQKNKEIALDNEYKKRLAVINATVTNEAKKGAMIIALDAEYDIKRRALQHSAAKQQKAFALAQAIINTAEGMTKALAQGGIFGPILAAVVGAFGAIQVALIAKQPIPLAKGAVFTKPTLLPATTYQVGDAGPGNPEIIAPKSTIRDAVREAMGQLMPQMAFAGAGAAYTINFKGPLIVTNAVLSEAEVNRAAGYLFRAVDREAHRRGGRLL